MAAMMAGALALAGCATTGSVKRAQGAADAAGSAAQRAQGSADAAGSAANGASSAAEGAMGAAQKAQSTADAAATAAQLAGVDARSTGGRVDVLERKVNYLMRHRRMTRHKPRHHVVHTPKPAAGKPVAAQQSKGE